MYAPRPTEVARLIVAACRPAGADRFRKARALALDAKHAACDRATFGKTVAEIEAGLAQRDFYGAVARRVMRLQRIDAAVDKYRPA